MQNLHSGVIISDSMSRFSTERLTPTKVASYIMGQGKVPKMQTYKTRRITLFFSIAHYVSARTILSV